MHIFPAPAKYVITNGFSRFAPVRTANLTAKIPKILTNALPRFYAIAEPILDPIVSDPFKITNTDIKITDTDKKITDTFL